MTIGIKRATKILIGALLLIAVVTAITRTSLHARRPQQQDPPTPPQGHHENPPVERVAGIPLSAQWVLGLSPLEVGWVDCKADAERGVDHCIIYNDETGSVSSEGDYVISDTRRHADADDLTPSGFDGTHIYLADGRVLEPLEDPLLAAKDKGIRCESRQYVAPVGSLRNKYCYRLQEWLVEASLRGNLEQIRKALAAGAHPEGTCYESFPPLISAAMEGHADAVALLLDHGAQVNLVVDFENTALGVAAYSGHADVVRVLLERGADPCYKAERETAGEIARKEGHTAVAELLKAAEERNCN